jgi:hypothetical protein
MAWRSEYCYEPGCRAVTEPSTYRLTQNGLWLSKKEPAGQLGAMYAIPILYVPVLMTTHVVAFYLLLRPEPKAVRAFVRDAAAS